MASTAEPFGGGRVGREGRIGGGVDRRTRPINAVGPADPESFFEVDWGAAVVRNGRRAATDAARLGLDPLAIRVDGDVWTIEPRGETIDVVPGRVDATSPCVTLDRPAF